MVTIRIEGSKIAPYKYLTFSGGEPHIEIMDPLWLTSTPVLLDARVASGDDMMELLAVTAAVKQCNPSRIRLFMPYFPGARQDRAEKGYAFTVKVYADLINAQGYDRVTILDPHSPVAPALLDRVCVLDPGYWIRQLILEHDWADSALVGLICPDAGAERRTLDLAKRLRIENVVFARKHRDVRTGALSGFELDPLPEEGTYLLADDICDGGGTFIGLAEEYRKDPLGQGELLLWVTHGIFSKGIDALTCSFDLVGCTDSFPHRSSCRHKRLRVQPLGPMMFQEN